MASGFHHRSVIFRSLESAGTAIPYVPVRRAVELGKDGVRILLVEDSERLQRSLSAGLRKCGYAVDVAGDGRQGLWNAESRNYDVIVLDLMLPEVDGLTVLRTLRSRQNNAPVLILTAKDTIEDRVRGLRSGADDYLIKPFAFDELLARIEALTRRKHGIKDPKIVLGRIEIDTAARRVSRGGVPIELTPREYALLEFLALSRGEVVSRTQIEAHIYDEQAEPSSNVVDAAVYALRKKIDLPDAPSLIETRRGMGYSIGTMP
jgi:DNA-binding response OmpR family regulator